METNLTTGWNPPPLSWLQLNDLDCEAASSWLGNLAQAGLQVSDSRGQPVRLTGDIPLDTSIAFVNSLVPSNWSRRPSRADLAAWYIEIWSNFSLSYPELEEARNKAILFPQEHCKDELCKSLRWEGDPDVSGVGMIVTYYILAGLTTFFFAYRTLYTPRQTRNPSRHVKSQSQKNGDQTQARTLRLSPSNAVEKFLDASLVFSAGYLIAAMSRLASAFRHYGYNKPVPVYGLSASVFMSAFSIFPQIIVQCLVPGIRDSFQRQILWFLILVVFIVVNIMFGIIRTVRHNPAWRFDILDSRVAIGMHDRLWLQVCNDMNVDTASLSTYLGGLITLCANAIWFLSYQISRIQLVTDRIPESVKKEFRSYKVYYLWQSHYCQLRTLNGIVAGAWMWIFLGVFHWFSIKVARKAGESDKDVEWTFGQVLAPVGFAQVAFDLVKYPEENANEGEAATSRNTNNQEREAGNDG